MAKKAHRAREALLPKTPLLATESRREFNRIRDALDEQIKPDDVIVQIYVNEFAQADWEIMRLQRCKIDIVNNEIRDGLREYIADNWETEDDDPKEMANTWYEGPQGKKEVRAALKGFQPNESAIEAEAVRKSLPELEKLEKLIVMAEVRRDRALRIIADYRFEFADKLRAVSNRLIDGEAIAIEDKTNNDQRSAV